MRIYLQPNKQDSTIRCTSHQLTNTFQKLLLFLYSHRPCAQTELSRRVKLLNIYWPWLTVRIHPFPILSVSAILCVCVFERGLETVSVHYPLSGDYMLMCYFNQVVLVGFPLICTHSTFLIMHHVTLCTCNRHASYYSKDRMRWGAGCLALRNSIGTKKYTNKSDNNRQD